MTHAALTVSFSSGMWFCAPWPWFWLQNLIREHIGGKERRPAHDSLVPAHLLAKVPVDLELLYYFSDHSDVPLKLGCLEMKVRVLKTSVQGSIPYETASCRLVVETGLRLVFLVPVFPEPGSEQASKWSLLNKQMPRKFFPEPVLTGLSTQQVCTSQRRGPELITRVCLGPSWASDTTEHSEPNMKKMNVPYHTTEYYSATKRSELLTHDTTWPWKYAKWSKPDTEGQLSDPTYMRYQE